MKLIHRKNGEETVIMEAPHEDALKARARDVEGYQENARWGPIVRGLTSGQQVEHEPTSESELELDDGSVLLIVAG